MDYWFAERGYQHTYAWNKIVQAPSLRRGQNFPRAGLSEDAWTTPLLIGLVSSQKTGKTYHHQGHRIEGNTWYSLEQSGHHSPGKIRGFENPYTMPISAS